jgi:hypothetical protein
VKTNKHHEARIEDLRDGGEKRKGLHTMSQGGAREERTNPETLEKKEEEEKKSKKQRTGFEPVT